MSILTEAGWRERESIFMIKPLFKSFDQVHSGPVLLTTDTKWAVFDSKDVKISLCKNMKVDFYHPAEMYLQDWRRDKFSSHLTADVSFALNTNIKLVSEIT